MVKVRDTDEWREMTAADHQRAVDALALPAAGVPPLVRRAFDRARTILLCAWTAPELSEVAELEALRGLEFILQHRLQNTDRRMGLKMLLRRAVLEGLLENTSELAAARYAHFEGLDFLEGLGTDWPAGEVLSELLAWIPTYRNNLAHGGQQHMPGGYSVMRVVRELILQVLRPAAC